MSGEMKVNAITHFDIRPTTLVHLSTSVAPSTLRVEMRLLCHNEAYGLGFWFM